MSNRGVVRKAWDFLFAQGEETTVVEQLAPLREAVGVTVDADEDQWTRLTGDTGRDLSPITQSRMREMSLYLWQQNLLANRLIELPLAFLLAEGVVWKVADPAIQKILDRFWRDPINQMDLKLAKKVRELALYGEQCYPAFVNDVNGHVRLGYLNPEHVATVVLDPDNPEQPIGIVTKTNRKGETFRYRIIVNGPEEVFSQRTRAIRETFNHGEVFWFTVNDLSDGARGRSDLLAQADWLDGYDMFLFGELDRAQFMRAFVWDVELTGADPEVVNKRAKEITAPRPGSVRVHNDREKWAAVTPNLQAGDNAETARLFRNQALGGASIPEHWFGGGGDVNRATAGEMGEPTFKIFSMRQQTLKHMLESIGRYVIRRHLLAHEQGEPDFEDERLNVQVEFPEMVARDTTRYAAALQQVVAACGQAVEKRLLTADKAVAVIAAVAGRLGVEIDAADELKKADAAGAKRDEDDVFTDPPESNTGGNP